MKKRFLWFLAFLASGSVAVGLSETLYARKSLPAYPLLVVGVAYGLILLLKSLIFRMCIPSIAFNAVFWRTLCLHTAAILAVILGQGMLSGDLSYLNLLILVLILMSIETILIHSLFDSWAVSWPRAALLGVGTNFLIYGGIWKMPYLLNALERAGVLNSRDFL